LLIGELFQQAAITFRDLLEMIQDDNISGPHVHWEIVMPLAIRGLLILMLDNYRHAFHKTVESMQILLQREDQASLYLERYIIQLSKEAFLKILDKL
jgi:hypothetical protein